MFRIVSNIYAFNDMIIKSFKLSIFIKFQFTIALCLLNIAYNTLTLVFTKMWSVPYVYKNERISKEIKKIAQEDHMTSSLSEGYFRDFLRRHKRVHFKWFEESGNKKLTIYVLDGHPRTKIVFGTYSSWIEAANDSELMK